MYANESKFDSIIALAAAQSGVPVPLIKAILANESGFVPSAMGDQGRAYGIGQMWLKTARGIGFTGDASALLNPAVAIPLTAKYLAVHLKKYGGNVAAAMSAYNAGHNMIPAAGPQAIPNLTNREYMRRGLLHLDYFSGAAPADKTKAALTAKAWPPKIQSSAPVSQGGGVGAAVLILVGVGVVIYFLTRR